MINKMRKMAQNTHTKVALVTGGSRGLGYAVAEKLMQHGVATIVCSRSQKIYSAQHALRRLYPDVPVDAFSVDLTDPEAVKSMFKTIDDRWGRLDICVNAAGYLALCPFIDMDFQLWQQVVQNNLTTCYLSCHHAFRLMARTDEPSSIVNISSLSGIRGCEKFSGMAPYIASKHAIVGLTESLSVEGKPYQIHVNCVAPGSFDTDMFREHFPEYQPGATAQEIAEVVLRFCGVHNERLFSGTIFEVYSNV